MIVTEPEVSRARNNRTLWAAASIVLLMPLYFVLRAFIGERTPEVAPIYSLVVAAPRPDEEMIILPARQNETVTLRIRSDRAGEVHVHGYDQNAILNVGAEVTLTFVAQSSGIYPIHLHERVHLEDRESPILHRQLAVLEVRAQ